MERAVLRNLIGKYPELAVCLPEVERAYRILKTCYENGGQVLVCGNGGSAADSEHIVGEPMKGFMSRRPVPDSFRAELARLFPDEAGYLAERLQGALPAISLVSHSALMTAFANDVDADMAFAQQVYGYGRPGDVLIGISTSGSSRNVVLALKVAKAKRMATIGLTGANGGKMKPLCDAAICVPYERTPDVQEWHLPTYHALCILIEEDFFGS